MPTLERLHKSFIPVTFKTVGQKADDGTTLNDGEFIATAAVFGNVDSYGDVVDPGAFTEDLALWAASGDVMSCIWSHDWMDPHANIGEVLTIAETGVGLQYKAAVDMDNPFAAQVYRLMKSRRVVQQSFSYDIIDAGWEVVDGDEQFHLKKLHIFEVGPCLVGVNQDTELLAIKSAARKGSPAPVGKPEEPSNQTEEPPSGSDPAPSGDGQAESAAGEGSNPGSSDSESPASKGFQSPASLALALQIEFSEGES